MLAEAIMKDNSLEYNKALIEFIYLFESIEDIFSNSDTPEKDLKDIVDYSIKLIDKSKAGNLRNCETLLAISQSLNKIQQENRFEKDTPKVIKLIISKNAKCAKDICLIELNISVKERKDVVYIGNRSNIRSV